MSKVARTIPVRLERPRHPHTFNDEVAYRITRAEKLRQRSRRNQVVTTLLGLATKEPKGVA